jgi:hypothetical protein
MTKTAQEMAEEYANSEVPISAGESSEIRRLLIKGVAGHWLKGYKQCEADKDLRIKELEKLLSEVNSCKLGNLVIYNPNGEDKDAKFVAGLCQSIQTENEKLQDENTLLTAKLEKADLLGVAGIELEQAFVHVIEEWKGFWMNQRQNDEADYQNYLHRALGVDANMKYHLAKKLRELMISRQALTPDKAKGSNGSDT